jgi:hypothetical protein
MTGPHVKKSPTDRGIPNSASCILTISNAGSACIHFILVQSKPVCQYKQQAITRTLTYDTREMTITSLSCREYRL